jgi:hypothetical protein
MEAIHSSESLFLQVPHGVTSRKMAFFKRMLTIVPTKLTKLPLRNQPQYQIRYLTLPEKHANSFVTPTICKDGNVWSGVSAACLMELSRKLSAKE